MHEQDGKVGDEDPRPVAQAGRREALEEVRAARDAEQGQRGRDRRQKAQDHARREPAREVEDAERRQAAGGPALPGRPQSDGPQPQRQVPADVAQHVHAAAEAQRIAEKEHRQPGQVPQPAVRIELAQDRE